MDLQTKAQYYEEEKNNAMKTLEEKMEMINKEHGEYQSLKDSIGERDNRIKELEQVVEGKQKEIEEMNNLNKAGGDEKEAKIKELMQKVEEMQKENEDLKEYKAQSEEYKIKNEIQMAEKEKELKGVALLKVNNEEKERKIQSLIDELTKTKNDNAKLSSKINEQNTKIKALEQNKPIPQQVESSANEIQSAPKEEEHKEEESNEDTSAVNLKTIFNLIRKVFLEYQETVDLLDNEKDTIFKNKFVQLSINENDAASQKYIEDIKFILSEVSKPQNNNCEALLSKNEEEINSLHVQIDSLNQTIKEKTDLLASLQMQNEQTKEELDNSTQLASSKDELIKNQMESIKMIKTEREKIKAEKEQLELKYNQVSVDSKMLEGEIDMLFTVLTTIIKKDKKGYETYVDKLSEENKLNIKALVEKFPKLFK